MKTFIKDTVKKIIKKYKTKDPYELCEFLNIKIFYEELGTINGYYQSCPKNKLIHLNKNLDKNFSNFVLAHELGHALLHSKLNVLFLETNTFNLKNRFEFEANTFAAELLIDDDLLDEFRNSNYTLHEIACIKEISEELVKLKFKLK